MKILFHDWVPKRATCEYPGCRKKLRAGYFDLEVDGVRLKIGCECIKEYSSGINKTLMEGWSKARKGLKRWVIITNDDGPPFRLIVVKSNRGGWVGRAFEGKENDSSFCSWSKPKATIEEAMRYTIEKFTAHAKKNDLEYAI